MEACWFSTTSLLDVFPRELQQMEGLCHGRPLARDAAQLLWALASGRVALPGLSLAGRLRPQDFSPQDFSRGGKNKQTKTRRRPAPVSFFGPSSPVVAPTFAVAFLGPLCLLLLGVFEAQRLVLFLCHDFVFVDGLVCQQLLPPDVFFVPCFCVCFLF